jgi:ABC-type thiamin/hydroxymethylpyrimidine transport system permease subunit
MTEAVNTTPQPAAPGETYPGKGLGIAGIILAILLPLIGLIVSLIANSQSKKAGYKNGPAKAGIIVGIILTVLGIIGGIMIAVGGAALFGGVVQACVDLGPGVHEVGGITYTCS